MKKMYLLLMVGIIVFLFLTAGCTEIEKMFDSCKKQYEECKYTCGEGWFSGLCKLDCSDRYDKCKRK